MHKPVKAFIVDDSALMRRMITDILQRDQEIVVVGFARNGEEALAKIARLKPDVITMDVEMPGMDGLETLAKIMSVKPLPVIMLSSVTTRGAETTLKALELGAVDFAAKPRKIPDMQELADELPRKVKVAAGITVEKYFRRKTVMHQKMERYIPAEKGTSHIEIVAVGTSTGGPSALHTLFALLPADFPAAMLVVQHMPKGFTKPLADRLNSHSALEVSEGTKGDVLKPGKAYVIPAGWQPQLKNEAGNITLDLVEKVDIETLFKPSVDVMLLEVARIYGAKSLGVVLTGMGNDGIRGLKALKEKGATTIVEAESSCVVYGMPKAAVEAGAADKQAPISEIAGIIMKEINKGNQR